MSGQDVKLQGDTLILSGALTFRTVPDVAERVLGILQKAAPASVGPSPTIVDCRQVTDADSSAISLLTQVARLIHRAGNEVQFTNLSQQMETLITLYEMDWLLDRNESSSPVRHSG